MTKELVLDISAGCGESGTCNCKVHPDGITATREVNKPVAGFIKLIHKSNIPFKLNKDLGGLSIIEVGGNRKDSYIQNVQSVSVYYWNGNLYIPILLGITKDGGKPTYYGRGGSVWGPSQVAGLSELQALDQKNCHNNNAVVFNIESSKSGTLTKDEQITCAKNRKIEESKSYNPPGSEYTAKAYIIKDLYDRKNTKISRVTYNGHPTGIPTISEAIDVITLYSYRASDNVPLMLEFKPVSGKDSKWYYSTNSTGKNWTEYIGNSNTFYDGGSDPKPTAKLSEKLDKVLCKWYNSVTINLSYNNSEDLSKKRGTGENKYCCSDHKDEYKVNVEQKRVSCKLHPDKSTITAYKHKITDRKWSLGGIYYNENDSSSNRQNIKLHGSRFPISGVRSIYTFYCSKDNPVLVYIDSPRNLVARGWYKEDGGEWKWISELIAMRPTDLSDLTCVKWMKLRKYLKDCGCNGLQECPESSNKVTDEKLEKELAEKAEKAQEKRRLAIQQQAASTKFGQLAATDSESPSDEEDEGSPGTKPDGAVEDLLKTLVKLGITGPALVGLAGLDATHKLAKNIAPKLVRLLSQTQDGSHGPNGKNGEKGEHDSPGKDTSAHTGSPAPNPEPSETPETSHAKLTGLLEAPIAIAGYFFAGSAGSGLTGFLGYKGYKLYQNFKGDPWVRQI